MNHGLTALARGTIIALMALSSAAAQSGPSESIRALELYRRGDCKQAVPLLEDILAHQPKSTAVRKLYASCLNQEGKLDEARAQYRMVLLVSPNDAEAIQALSPAPAAPKNPPLPSNPQKQRTDPTAQLAEAAALVKAQKVQEAEKVLEKSVSAAPQSITARQRLAELYSTNRQYSKAAEMYAELARETKRPMYLERAAQNRAWNKEYETAITLYREYLVQASADAGVRLELANVLMWAGKLDDSEQEFRTYLQSAPQNVEARLSFGNVLLWMARYADAVEQFKLIEASHPSDPRAQLGMGQAYEHMGQFDLALKAYDQTLKLNPSDPDAQDARVRLESELPRKRAFESIQANDNERAAKFFIEYLKDHPESDETVLQIARAYAWAKKPAQAVPYYRQYHKRKPDDLAAERELAKAEMTVPDYPGARETYTLLASTAAATVEDYEGLIHAYVWDNQIAAAQPVAAKLAAIDNTNQIARETIDSYVSLQKSELTEQAESLTSAKRFSEAIDLYRDYVKRFGKDRQTELAIARLYGWSGQNSDAVAAYHNYLLKYPEDEPARLEMAKIETWSKDYKQAAADFRTILKSDARSADALLGLAQVTDYTSNDPFNVIRGYRDVLASDPGNSTARARVAELAPLTSPSIGYGYKSFGDSDGFYRGVNTIEGALPMPGDLKFTGYYQLGYFHQLRQIGGAGCGDTSPDFGAAAAALSSKICDRNGTFWENGGGVKAQLGSLAGTNFIADIGMMNFGGASSTWTLRSNLTLALGDQRLSFQIVRAPAVFDLDTVASLAAGVVGETALASYSAPFGARWKIGAQAGVTHYTATGGDFSTNLQRRLSAVLSYTVNPEFTAGYYVRYSSFQRQSPLYFSPPKYGEYGFSYGWKHSISRRTSLLASGEIGLGRIDRIGQPALDTLEMAVEPSIAWQLSPGLEFRLGYRLSRSRASAFGSPAYTTGGADFGIVKSLATMPQTFDPNQLELH